MDEDSIELIERYASTVLRSDVDAKLAVKAFKRGFAKATVEAHEGSVAKAALAVNLSRTNIYRWMGTTNKEHNHETS